MRRAWTWVAMLILTLSNAHALVLTSLECPDVVYLNEVFSCKAYFYNAGTSTEIIVDVRGTDGLSLQTEVPVPATISLDAGELKEFELNGWMFEGGKGEVRVLYGYENPETVVGREVRGEAPPLRLRVPVITAEAGKRKKVTLKLVGKAYSVNLWVDTLPVLQVDVDGDVGDVDGSKSVSMYVSPDPFAMGRYPMDVYVRFMDNTGYHTLRYRVEVNVVPATETLLVLGGMLALLIGGLALWWRRRKPQEEK